jgi:hypothetical protein
MLNEVEKANAANGEGLPKLTPEEAGGTQLCACGVSGEAPDLVAVEAETLRAQSSTLTARNAALTADIAALRAKLRAASAVAQAALESSAETEVGCLDNPKRTLPSPPPPPACVWTTNR